MAQAKGQTIFYREVQHFHQVWLWILVLCISLLAIYAGVQQLILGKPFGSNPAPDVGLIIIVVIFGLGLPAFFFMTNLTTEVRSDGLYIRFFPFHLSSHKIAWEKLRRYEVRTYSALKEYGGWGIRYGSKGKAYNVKGNHGVQLELSNGQKVLIGSQRPEELAQAIELASGKRIGWNK
jgi:hypothetical protein